MSVPTVADVLTAWRGGRPADALRLARAVVAANPIDVDAQRVLAEILAAANELPAAMEAARRVVALVPQDAAAYRKLAELHTRAGNAPAAVEALQRSLEFEPNNARALNNLGNLLTGLGRAGDAIEILTRAIECQNDYLPALINLGVAYAQTGRVREGIDCYRRALDLNPASPEALLNLGRAYRRVGQLEAALEVYQRARAVKPLDAETPTAVAEIQLALKRHPEALLAASEAVTANPHDPRALIALGYASLRGGKLDEALVAFDTAKQVAPVLAAAHAGRADTLDALGRMSESLDAYEEAARLEPGNVLVLVNSGRLLLRLGNAGAALAAFDAALAVDPADVGALEGHAISLVMAERHEEAFHALTDLQAKAPWLDYLAGHRFQMQRYYCDWRDFEAARSDISARILRGERADLPLSFMSHSTEPGEQRACAEIYVSDKFSGAVQLERAARTDRARLRVAYLSADFRNHPVGQLTVGIFESHDRSRFETYGLCAAPDDGSELRRRLAAAFDHFEEIGSLSDKAVAERVAALEIDVLIDLGGHTLGSRTGVLAHRPAAVQISFLGFPGTLGSGVSDYIIADRHVIPEDERAHYAEQVIYLPDSYLPNDFPGSPPTPPPRQAVGLPADAVVLCSFNSAFKFTPAVFEVWMRVLTAVPSAVLWLRDGSATMKRNLAYEAKARGVESDRLVYASRTPGFEQHQARLALADLFLDTTPYNAHTTASEALAAGVPVITLPGRTFGSRVATSLLHAVDLGHLSVQSLAAYEQLAIELSQSPARRAALKAHLHRVRTNAPLFDTVRFCRHLEDALLEVVERQRRGEPPAPVYVARRNPRATAIEGWRA